VVSRTSAVSLADSPSTSLSTNTSCCPPDEHFSNLKEVAEHFAMTDQDARFDLLIHIFIDGIAAQES
jgi:hypothetical protein